MDLWLALLTAAVPLQSAPPPPALSTLPPPCEGADAPSLEDGTSERLHARGLALAMAGTWYEAALNVEAAAVLREKCDPEAIEIYRMAAHLYHYAGELASARAAMQAAAERARRLGELARSAHAYLDAAKFAYASGEPTAALTPIAGAWEIAEDERLTVEERERILERFELEVAEEDRPDGGSGTAFGST